MLSIDDEALVMIRAENRPLYLDMPPLIRGGCCVNIQECPTVRFGEPRDTQNYVEREVRGIKVYLPRRFPMDRQHTITVSSFLGMKKIVLEGWCPL